MLYIIARHGESEDNARDILSGQESSAGLTEKGNMHAYSLVDILKPYSVDMIYSSDLVRARETVAPVSQHIKKEPVFDKRLREKHFGILENSDYSARESSEHWQKFRDDRVHYRIPGGESYLDVWSRSGDLLSESNNSGFSCVLIMSHYCVNKTLLGHLMGIDISKIWSIYQDNPMVYFVNTEKQECFWIHSIDGNSGRNVQFV